MDRSKLLERANTDEERMLIARVLDKQAQAEKRNIPACTDFLNPHELALAEGTLHLAGILEENRVVSGGYEGAERKAILFLPDWQMPEDARFPFQFLRASYPPAFHLSHRDFLGSLMGMGIVRGKVGDLLISDQSCDLVVMDTTAEFLIQNWNQAGRANLKLSVISLTDLKIPEIQCEEIRSTVQSLRLDAIMATGFRISRGKAVSLIKSGHVEVNWRECVKPDRELLMGDTVSTRGFGKFRLEQVGGVTRKGRTGIVLKRYV